MARPRTIFTDDQLRGILAAASAAAAHAPERNDVFLDHFIAGVARATGRIFGQPIYVRLLDTAGIGRRPSAPTWSAAIARARSASPSPLHPDPHPTSSTPEGSLPLVRAFAADARSRADDRDEAITDLKVRAQLAEATLRDAYRKITALESERVDVLRRVAMAEAQARAAERRQQEVTAEKDAIADTLWLKIDALAAAEGRLAGLEKHLRLQTDQLRTELSQEVRDYKSRLETAEKALDRERIQVDALRRVLGNRGSSDLSANPSDAS